MSSKEGRGGSRTRPGDRPSLSVYDVPKGIERCAKEQVESRNEMEK